MEGGEAAEEVPPEREAVLHRVKLVLMVHVHARRRRRCRKVEDAAHLLPRPVTEVKRSHGA